MALNDQTVKKIEINKEIVLLRQPVRKARVKVISRLTREAKQLRAKRGDEKQLEKNKRKADKLGREIIALKKVKDDEISKFGIFRLETLQKTIQDASVADVTRAIAKVANHKSLAAKIEEFRKKFPDYEKYISSSKQNSKSKKKKSSELKSKESKKTIIDKEQISLEEKNENDSDNSEKGKHDEQDNSSPEQDISPQDVNQTDKNNATNKKISTHKSISPKLSKMLQTPDNNMIPEETSIPMAEPSKTVKVISKQATVKRFTEILTEDTIEDTNAPTEDCEISTPQSSGNTEIQKAVDDFFISANGNDHHLAVVPSTQVEDDTTIHFTEKSKDRYFSKISSKKPTGRPFSHDRKWESILKRKGQWSIADLSMEYKGPRDKLRQDFKSRNPETETKKMKRNQEVKNPQENESLHPSWQARKKQQEIMKKGFQGKKIVFEDE